MEDTYLGTIHFLRVKMMIAILELQARVRRSDDESDQFSFEEDCLLRRHIQIAGREKFIAWFHCVHCVMACLPDVISFLSQ